MRKYICLKPVLLIFLTLLQSFIPVAALSAASEQTETQFERINIPPDVINRETFLKVLHNVDGLTYQIGSKSAGVREFQNVLISVGYSSIGKADGVYGNKTAEAVREFQAAHNLAVTGQADLYTQFLLVMSSSSLNQKGNAYIARVENYAVIIWRNKAFYIGALDNSGGLMEGTYYYFTGCSYAGEYKNDLRSGKGTAHFANGDVYVGQWKDDAMHGQGTYYYGGLDSTEYYKGNMTNNAMNGKGTYYRNNRRLTGKWSNNQHISR